RAGEGDVQALTRLAWIDYVVMLLYFAFVLGIGATLRRYVHTSEDFFLSGRSIPAWVTGLAFISANLGAQEVIGMGASGAKYGVATSHFYWVGAIPAMVFVGLFMMPFYYGSRARSVPEYLKLGFGRSFGYWCTDFLVGQRAMAANSMTAARRTPLIAALPKMMFPFLVIIPGMLAMAVSSTSSVRQTRVAPAAQVAPAVATAPGVTPTPSEPGASEPRP